MLFIRKFYVGRSCDVNDSGDDEVDDIMIINIMLQLFYRNRVRCRSSPVALHVHVFKELSEKMHLETWRCPLITRLSHPILA